MNYEGIGGYGASPYSSGGPAGGEPYVKAEQVGPYGQVELTEVQTTTVSVRAQRSRAEAIRSLNEADRYSYNGDARRNALLEAQVWATIYAADVEAEK